MGTMTGALAGSSGCLPALTAGAAETPAELECRERPGRGWPATPIPDGETYAPGARGGTLIIPRTPGAHTFEVRPLEQPPVYRNGQGW